MLFRSAVWSVAIETFGITAILGLALGLAGVVIPVSWQMVGAWAVAAGLLGHLFEGPIGVGGEVLAVIVLALGAIVLATLNNTSLFEADRKTWNNLAAAAAVAVVGMAVAPLSTVLDVKDLVALALAGAVYRVLDGTGSEQRITILGALVSGLALRWLVIGSLGSGDSAVFLDIQLLATLTIGVMTVIIMRSGSRWFSADAMIITSSCMLVAALTYQVVSPFDSVETYNHGPGVMLAIVASAVMLAGAVLALQTAPYSAFRPLDRIIGWGHMAVGILAVVLVLVGSISGWTFDERAATDLPDDVKAELIRLRDETNEFPAMAASNAAIAVSLRNKYRMTALEVTDGLSEDGGEIGRAHV